MSLKRSLSHVYWLGGSGCSGKTTIARSLAELHGLALYHCDEHFHDHAKRLDPQRHPHFSRIKNLSPEELWMRPIEVQVAEMSGFYDEELEMVVEDLLSMPSDRALLVEGAGLRPGKIVELIQSPRRGFWLVASPEFRRREYPRRGRFVEDLLDRCSDPQGAFENWMRRDERRAEILSGELESLGLSHLEVDGRRSIEDTMEEIARHFALAETSFDAAST